MFLKNIINCPPYAIHYTVNSRCTANNFCLDWPNKTGCRRLYDFLATLLYNLMRQPYSRQYAFISVQKMYYALASNFNMNVM